MTTPHWERLGHSDPFWAVLTEPEKKGGLWALGEFYELGRRQMAASLRELAQLELNIHYGRALDFGCGVGRLSLALAEHFEVVHGVDGSRSMLDVANLNNTAPERVTYYLNKRSDLSDFESDAYDLVYSDITLQHVRRAPAMAYIRDFVRVLKPGGTIWFQLPCRLRLTPRNALIGVVPEPLLALQRGFEMHAMKSSTVMALLREAGATVLRAERDNHAGPRWLSYHYIATKRAHLRRSQAELFP